MVAPGRSLTASTRALRIMLPVTDPTPDIVDIYFDDHRVWSTSLARAGTRASATWPAPLQAYLSGETEIRVVDSSSGQTVAQGRGSFPGHGRVSVTDTRGRWLAMNKWDRLGPTLDGDDTGLQGRLLADAVVLVQHLEEWGYPVYIVGGTLLGALRTGEIMPHDDDIDLAWLCEEETLADVALASFEMERRLVDSGLTVLRLGLAHLQVTYFTDDGYIGHYVDIFTGFYDGGLYNQPFALRGHLDRADLLPVSRVQLNGATLPAPARPEGWLEYSYGPSWLVPDPSFKFIIKPATKRLFESVFGVYNRQRIWWEKYYDTQPSRPTGRENLADGDLVVDRFLERLPAASRVIDLGCGDGRLTSRIAAAGHRVTGYDYSYEGLRLARQHPTPGLDLRHLNANNRHDMLRVALELAGSGDDVWFFAHSLLHVVPPNGRESVYLMLRAVLNDRTRAYVSFFSDRHPRRNATNPNTWELGVRALHASLRSYGLSMHVVNTQQVQTSWGERTMNEAVLWR